MSKQKPDLTVKAPEFEKVQMGYFSDKFLRRAAIAFTIAGISFGWVAVSYITRSESPISEANAETVDVPPSYAFDSFGIIDLDQYGIRRVSQNGIETFDVDGDGDLDIVISGSSGGSRSIGRTIELENRLEIDNPDAPEHLYRFFSFEPAQYRARNLRLFHGIPNGVVNVDIDGDGDLDRIAIGQEVVGRRIVLHLYERIQR